MLSVINFEPKHLRHSTHRNWDYSNSELLPQASSPARRTPISFYSNPFYYRSRCFLIFHLSFHFSHIKAFSIFSYHSSDSSQLRWLRCRAFNGGFNVCTLWTLNEYWIQWRFLGNFLHLSSRFLSPSLSVSQSLAEISVDQVFLLLFV